MIEEAGSENEILKVVNDVNKPRTESEWSIQTNEGQTRDNQHGFRAKRSTMTAWAGIQHDWAVNT
jgi:hypothetical protein